MFTAIDAYRQILVGKFESDEGAGIVEYVLLIVAIALVVLVAMRVLEGSLSETFNDIADRVEAPAES